MFEKITVILKPTNACNIRCKYCYHEESGYENNSLALANLEKLLRLLATNVKEILITWHGGEPTLMGLPYFEKAVELERQVEKEHDNNIKFVNIIQTNGTLLNAKWIKFFKENNFKVGVSFDGPTNSVTREKTERVMENVGLMQKAGMHVSCLAVISKPNIDQISVYEYFKQHGIHCVFNPIIAEGAGMTNTDLLITSQEYIDSSIRLFDHWIYDTNGVNISLFSGYISTILGVRKAVCNNVSCIGKWICMEPDGKLQLCSHFSGDEFAFGNVNQYDSLDEVFASDNIRKLLTLSINKREICQKSGCSYYKYCHGGCVHANIRQNTIERTGGFDCEAFKAIFGHVQKFVQKALADNIDINTLNPNARACFIDYVSCIKED